MKKYILLLIVPFLSFNTEAQIGMSFEEVVDSYGENYEQLDKSFLGDIHDFGISYRDDYENGGWSAMACIFSKLDKRDVCVEVWIAEDRARINYWIKKLREEQLVEEKMSKDKEGRDVYLWKDYSNKVQHEITVDDESILYIKSVFF